MPDPNINQADIAENVLDAVTKLVGITSLDIPVEYEYLSADTGELPMFSVQTLNGNPIEKTYVDGSYVANYRFGIVLRQAADDTRERLDARAILVGLSDALAENPPVMPDKCTLWSLERDTLPSRSQAEAKFVDYLVTLTLKYKKTR